MAFLRSKYFYFVFGLGIVYTAVVITLFRNNQDLAISLFASEGNFGENLAAVSWFLGFFLSSIQIIGHSYYRRDLTAWIFISTIFLFAGIREMDMHNVILSNVGVMLRTEWLRDQNVAMSLKVIAVGVVLAYFIFLSKTLLSRKKDILLNISRGNVALALVGFGVLITAVYTAFDGTMLGSRFIYDFIDKPVAEVFEEVGETIGAMFCSLSILPYAFKANID